MIRPTAFVLALGVVGCSQPPEPQSVVAVTTAIETPATDSPNSPGPVAQPTPAPAAQTQPPKPVDVPPVFEYPPDLTGKAVVKAVAPDTPALTPAERFGLAPKPRTAPTKLLNPEPIAKAKYVPPPILPGKPSGVAISPPVERVPFDLGRGAEAIPVRPTLPISVGITDRARDVNIPPAMPTLGRQFNERVALDDPTSEFGNAAIVAPSVKVPLAPSGFVKVTVPDPFELGEQVKPKVAPTAEPGLSPVPVNPQRVK